MNPWLTPREGKSSSSSFVSSCLALFHRHNYDTLVIEPGLIQVACWCGARSPGITEAPRRPPTVWTTRLQRFRRRLVKG